jgi:hypothetical protein
MQQMRFISLLFGAVLLGFSAGQADSAGIDAALADHLVARWTFNESDGTSFADVSGNGFNGKTYSSDFGAGLFRNCLIFDSVLDEAHIPEKGIAPPVAIGDLQYGSISVWFNYQSLGAQILPILYFGESETGTPHNSLIIEIGHGGGTNPANRKLYFTIVNQRFCYDSNVNLAENVWHHFVAVVGPAGNTGFLNGAEMADRHYNLGSDASYTDFFANVPAKETLAIGYGRYGQEDPFLHFNGMIDDVRIYDKPLAATEAESLYDALSSKARRDVWEIYE